MNFTTVFRHKITALIVALVLAFPLTPALASPSELTETKDQLKSLNSRLSETRRKIKEAKEQEHRLVGQIEETDGRVISVQKEYDRLSDELSKIMLQRGYTERQLTQLQAELWKTQQDLEHTQERLNEQKGILNKRLQNIYKRGEVSYVDFILNSTDFMSLLNRIRFLEFIIAQDLDIVRRIEETKRQIQIREQQVERDKHAVNTERTELINQERTIKQLTDAQLTQKQALQMEIGKKQSLLSQIQQNRAAYELAEDQLLAQSKSLSSRIRELERSLRGRTAPRSGSLAWPTEGRVTSQFGMRLHPILKTRRMHTGIDIGAPYGQAIVAADGGIVIQAGSLTGYGQTVVISHGGGISTLYAHMSKILVSEGQSVSRGATIGRIGSTGLSTGPHLHFEVRKDGEPQNPMNWY